MQTSPEINELAAALAKAQGEFTPAERSRHNPFTNTYYATLADILAVCRKPLADNGLSILQTPEPCEQADSVEVTTRLLHASGQWIEGIVSLPVLNTADKNGVRKPADIQTYMSAITYARRAGLLSILGIAPDSAEEDDGNAAAGKATPRAASNGKTAADANGPATAKQIGAIRNLCGDKYDPEGTAESWYQTALDTLSGRQAAQMIKKLQDLKKPAEARS